MTTVTWKDVPTRRIELRSADISAAFAVKDSR
jgi:hypothetical protein